MPNALTLLLATSLGGCGGGGGGGAGGDPDDWLYPLTVPTDVAVVDLDGDGRQDVLTLEQLSSSETDRKGRLLFYRQTGTGTFAAPVVTLVGTYPWHFAIADLDGDGAPDVVIIDAGANSAWLLWQDAAQRGRFEPPLQLAANIHGYDPVVADLNGDGAPDIALPGSGNPPAAVRILYQDPRNPGAFLPAVDLPMPGSAPHAAAGDLNQDGRTDLAVSVLTSGGGTTPPTILLGYRPQLADGTLGPLTSPASHTGLNVARLAVADYDGDGAQDLFAHLTPYSSQYDATLTVVLQDALPGTFLGASNTRLDDVRGLDDAAFADLDRDGRPDAAVAGSFPVGSPSTIRARVNLFTQSGGGLFAPTTVHEMPVTVSRIAAGDLNGDGALDLVAFAGADGCQALLQSAASPGVFSPPRALR